MTFYLDRLSHLVIGHERANKIQALVLSECFESGRVRFSRWCNGRVIAYRSDSPSLDPCVTEQSL